MQKIIDAEKSELFDVLAHVASALRPVTREVRAANARVHINTRFSAKQQVFLDFVLQHYITVGLEELAPDRLIKEVVALGKHRTATKFFKRITDFSR